MPSTRVGAQTDAHDGLVGLSLRGERRSAAAFFISYYPECYNLCQCDRTELTVVRVYEGHQQRRREQCRISCRFLGVGFDCLFLVSSSLRLIKQKRAKEMSDDKMRFLTGNVEESAAALAANVDPTDRLPFCIRAGAFPKQLASSPTLQCVFFQ